MQTRHLLRSLPFLMMALLATLAVGLHFNGLYGQDAHEYLRQSRVIVGRLSGQAWVPEGLGEVDFAGGYPLAGAWLQMLGLEVIVAMQAVSVLSAGAVLWLFERLLRLLTPGTSQRSRLLYAALPLALSPMMIRAGLVSMSDALGLALAMAALWQGLRAMEPRQASALIWAAVFAVLAVTTRFALAALLLPMAVAVAWRMAKRGGWGWLAAAAGATSARSAAVR